MSIIAVAAMMFVSCKKEDTKTDGNEQKQETVDPELVGTWTIVGKANGWDETAGVAMTESDNVWTVAEVAIKGEGFKFVKDGSWDINLGASPKTGSTQKFDDDVEFDLEKNGDNIAGAKDGVYSVTLNLLTKKAKIAFVKDLEPETQPAITVATWAEAEAAGAITFFQYRAAAGWAVVEGYDNVEADTYENLTVKDGVYTINYEEASDGRWQSQFYLRPNPEKATLPLSADKYYEISITMKANNAFGVFAKFCAYNAAAAPKREGETMQEWFDSDLNAGAALVANTPRTFTTVVKGVDCDNVNWTLDFGTHPANTTIEVSGITVKEVIPVKYKKVDEITSGKSYMMAYTDGETTYTPIVITDAATTYGYYYTNTATVEDGVITLFNEDNALIFTQSGEGWLIQQQFDKRYAYCDGSHGSVQLSAEAPVNLWTISMADGAATISFTNASSVTYYFSHTVYKTTHEFCPVKNTAGTVNLYEKQ